MTNCLSIVRNQYQYNLTHSIPSSIISSMNDWCHACVAACNGQIKNKHTSKVPLFLTQCIVSHNLDRPRGYKTFFSGSTQQSMTFILLINVKMPTIVGILTFINMIDTKCFCRNLIISRINTIF